MTAKLSTLLTRFPPVRWFRAAEAAVFRLASEVEYRLKIVPRGTKFAPSTFDRRMVRLFLIVLPVLVSTLFVDGRPMRARVLFGILIVAGLALAVIFVADAFPTKRSSLSRPPGPRPPTVPPSSRRPPSPKPPVLRP